jgi:hypothetical protein
VPAGQGASGRRLMQGQGGCETIPYNSGSICVAQGSFLQSGVSSPKKLMDEASIGVNGVARECPLQEFGTLPPCAPAALLLHDGLSIVRHHCT